jgi:AraC-like DNA-binding protein
MQRAWQLLKVGELNVQQVADRVGYSNLAAFSDRFRKHFGQSPRYFRPIAK